MKKFDISNLMISRIADLYGYTLPEEYQADGCCEHAALVIKHRGESDYCIDGKHFAADASHILYLPAHTEYSLFVEEEGACTVIEFDTVEGGSCDECCLFFVDNEKEIQTAAQNILHYWNLKGPAYHSKCLSEIYNLLTQISTIQSYAYTLAGKYHLIHRSVKYIETHYRLPDLYTPMLAEMSGMGETYYRSIFQAVFGVPPTKYIQQYRVEKAKTLLVNSAGSVEEIAVSVGFANSSYFCKVFKSVTGMTPSEFVEHGRKFG